MLSVLCIFAILSLFIFSIGLCLIVGFLFRQLRTPLRILKIQLCYNRNPKYSLKERFGSWAAVTGSSDGIGKEYAKELARHGINVVLIARNEEKLKAVANEIIQESKVETKIVVADFTQGPEVYEHIEHELADTPIAIFVNNVGMSLQGAIYAHTKEDVQKLIDTNIVAVSQLSRYFFKRLQDSHIKGAIVNLCPVMEHQPFGAMYAASKAYIRSFTLALGHEAARYGIHVQLLSPGFVVTKMENFSTRLMRGSLFVPTADMYARSAVAQLRACVVETSGYVWHQVLCAGLMLLPWRLRLLNIRIVCKNVSDKQWE
ncbi:hydroxysteroid dehydrogenase-like protein 1 [Drosophila sulfurigaster albostrigata]|uniref:hydroxysteroid dehydrogenase-like protein 1 n=1 Tax=Drosophila sulfurigaster albostrigata TaxID=89887 RepID=UPI002D21E62C|nr:hydroxysteroid dehydrogenase-like protein 1 [Drosophila sulfurigaster albostrigata]